MTVRGVQCAKCDEQIWSRTRHDFRVCTCGFTFVDGGRDYTRYGTLSECTTESQLLSRGGKDLSPIPVTIEVESP